MSHFSAFSSFSFIITHSLCISPFCAFQFSLFSFIVVVIIVIIISQFLSFLAYSLFHILPLFLCQGLISSPPSLSVSLSVRLSLCLFLSLSLFLFLLSIII